ncbi:acyl-CoA dehydrogenase family protein [Planococcus sp. CP5-4]|uniref:acyl-CoA dehydrogenase family protein n=1 Tax=unclassified Planococcus (in: firmicutes) TaxID=2662419 RepID=UPI001C235267|nr:MULTISPECIES: acyl-CoA dehydrogenase family protein [unclassified Planococcus (in: firmicutes)]MBU9673647.1 acyl-CoA dehydrogenase family protein [Planococcus sp. CP5-4_YE]MBV0907937.1 acyl-CoA dehydrogenase family protein [Planococcus sp. CP5-4_UN]MBW6063104.1 acyl-CoA dehydrogenase family protein [Planococcus sp. CP5-4]
MVVLKGTAPSGERNFYTNDETLKKILAQQLPKDFLHYAQRELQSFGKLAAGDIDERARHTDREGAPKLEKYNRLGEDISHVWVNEGYRKTVDETYKTGIVGYVHKEIPQLERKGNYVYSFAQGYLLSQSEPGFYCPVTLTMATAYLLDHYADAAVKEKFLPHVCATGDMELFEGATFLTERQGGSDVGANVVQALETDDGYRLYGEKYFASNAGMAGVAMVLARRQGAPKGSKGLTLFAVPWKVDGELNGIKIRRLKDKLGVRAVPSGEVEFDGAKAYAVGDPKNGLKYMMEALNLSRICNAVASIGIMKRALDEATEYAGRRNAFGQQLTDFPMVQDSLMKLRAKQEFETAAIFDLIGLYDRVTEGSATEEEQVLNRLLIAILKKESAEQAIHFSHEAIEMHGGNGYIEDFVTPRLLRDAQVLTVWEGTANILGLELIRLVNKLSAHEIFIEHIEGRLAKLQASADVELLKEKTNELQTELAAFAGFDAALQSFDAKSLMKKMAQLFENIVALEWAEQHGGMYAPLSEIFTEATWNTRTMGKDMKTVRYFKEVMGK